MGRRRRKKKQESTYIAYEKRNRILLSMGFESYEAYRKSDLWKGIRDRVLTKDAKCVGCGKKPNQVHHSEYTPENLRGSRLDHLHPICRDCHEHIEFNGERKCSLKEVADRLAALRGEVIEPVPPKPEKPKKHRQPQGRVPGKKKNRGCSPLARKPHSVTDYNLSADCGLYLKYQRKTWEYFDEPVTVEKGCYVKTKSIHKACKKWDHLPMPATACFNRAILVNELEYVFAKGDLFICVEARNVR